MNIRQLVFVTISKQEIWMIFKQSTKPLPIQGGKKASLAKIPLTTLTAKSLHTRHDVLTLTPATLLTIFYRQSMRTTQTFGHPRKGRCFKKKIPPNIKRNSRKMKRFSEKFL